MKRFRKGCFGYFEAWCVYGFCDIAYVFVYEGFSGVTTKFDLIRSIIVGLIVLALAVYAVILATKRHPKT
jgi:galactitol-specific phosphotransferase system IIC component